MPKYAVINSGTVENVILAGSAPTISGRVVVLLTTQAVSPGDAYNGSVFTPYQPTARELALFQAPENVRAAYPTLKQWSIDAAATYAAATAGSRALTAAEQREFIRRVGIFFDRFADLLLYVGLDS